MLEKNPKNGKKLCFGSLRYISYSHFSPSKEGKEKLPGNKRRYKFVGN